MAGGLNLPMDCPTLDVWRRCYEAAPPNLNTLRRAFTALVRWAFSNTDNTDGYAEALKCLTWSADGSKSQLQIQPGSVQDPGDTLQVPAVLISCGQEGIQLQPYALNSHADESPDTASHRRVWSAKVNMTFACRAWDADVACLMADFVLMFLTAMEPKLRRTFGWLTDYKPVSQTEPVMTSVTQTEDATKWYESKVVMELTYTYSVFVAEESKRLKDFTVAATPALLK